MTKIKKYAIAIYLAAGFSLAGSSPLKAQEAAYDHMVCAGNQANSRYEAYDPTVADWNSSSALKWSFAPSTANGWTSAEVAAYSNPSDMKLRFVGNGPNQVVVSCASGGLATMATTSGSMVWAMDVGGANNPHSVELLPNGNIAVAASAGNWVRVYASSQSSRNGTYTQFNLTDAHAVLWDPLNNVLWALGGTTLTALSVGGTAANPTLSEVAGDRVSLPSSSGHDLSAYWGDPDLLWVTVSFDVYIYKKSAKTFYTAPGSISRSAVKGCGNQQSGEIVQCQQDNSECTLNTWCTPHVNFFNSGGASDYTRTRTGAAFYKCRVFWPEYQPTPNYPSPYYDFNVTAQGWTSDSALNPVTWTACCGWPGIIYATQTGADAYFIGGSLACHGESNDVIQVHVYPQNGNTGSHQMNLYWKTIADPNFNESKTTAQVQYTAQNQWATINFPVGQNPSWNQQAITQLRLDVDDDTTSSIGTTWIIDSIGAAPLTGPGYGFDSDAEGWTSGHGLNPVTWTACCGWPGIIYATQTAADGYFIGPNMGYEGVTNDVIQVHVYPQNGNTSSHQMKVYWQTDNDPNFSESKSTALVQYTAQNAWATVNIPVGQSANWALSYITRLRLDIDDNSTNSVGTTWIIDSIDTIRQ